MEKILLTLFISSNIENLRNFSLELMVSLLKGLLLLLRFYFQSENKNWAKVFFGYEIKLTVVYLDDLLANVQTKPHSVVTIYIEFRLFAVNTLSRLMLA